MAQINALAELARARGVTGTVNQSGFFSGVETNRKLRDRKGTGTVFTPGVFAEMRTDPSIDGCVLSWRTPLVVAQWIVVPGGDTARDKRLAEETEEWLFRRQKRTWSQIIGGMATNLIQFGHDVQELVPTRYETKRGERWAWCLEERLPESIAKWEFERGEFVGVRQEAIRPGTSERVAELLPAETLMVFTHELRGDNLAGRSLLRSCYGPYLQRKLYRQLEAIGHEREMLAIPRASRASGVPNMQKASQDELSAVLDTLMKLRSHEQSAIVQDDNWIFDFLNSPGAPQRMEQIRKSIDNLGAEIRAAMLLDKVGEATTEAGAKSTTPGQEERFWIAVEGELVTPICDTFNGTATRPWTGVIRRFHDLNSGPQPKYPTLACPNVRVVDVRTLIDAVFKSEQADALRADPAVRAIIHHKLGLPPPVEIAPAPKPTPVEPVPSA